MYMGCIGWRSMPACPCPCIPCCCCGCISMGILGAPGRCTAPLLPVNPTALPDIVAVLPGLPASGLPPYMPSRPGHCRSAGDQLPPSSAPPPCPPAPRLPLAARNNACLCAPPDLPLLGLLDLPSRELAAPCPWLCVDALLAHRGVPLLPAPAPCGGGAPCAVGCSQMVAAVWAARSGSLAALSPASSRMGSRGTGGASEVRLVLLCPFLAALTAA